MTSPREWLIGVQWHPEQTITDELQDRLLENFVREARRYRERRAAAE